ncbi:TPA: hypothetical protein DCR79_00175 [Patescibacteria group bacterium]|nr:hypothetical protein [Patescibacteria group bacterium]
MPRKKVVFIINNFVVGGVERFSRDLWSHWDHQRIELIVISVWGSGVLVDSYRKAGIPVYWAGSKLVYSSKNPLLKLYFTIIAPLVWCRLVLLLRRLRPAAVLTCLTQADILGIAAAKFCHIPVRIIHQADIKVVHPLVKWLKQNLAVRWASTVIANSAPTGEFMQNYFGASVSKVIVIPNGINLNRFSHISTQPIRVQRPVVGFLGRLEVIKGIQYFVPAINLLKTQYNLMPPVVIFGDGSLREAWEAFAQQNQLTNISWRGEVLQPESALPEIDILVMPSQSEGFGFVLLEGLAAARVVVASDLPVFSYITKSSDIVSFFPMGNPPALAEILAKLIQNPQLLIQLQAKVRAWMIKHGSTYDLANIAQAYQDVLVG